MFWRIVSFVLCQAIPATAGWFLVDAVHRPVAAIVLALLGTYVWLVLDALRGLRLLHWLLSVGIFKIPQTVQGLFIHRIQL